ncbi:MAG: hypothetical protein ACP5NI_02550 [Acetobacteraceae bacterium]
MPPDPTPHAASPADGGRLQRFVANLLARSGALVEPLAPEGLEVLASPAVQEAFGLAEFARLGFGASLPAGAQRVGLEGDWLERSARLLGERGRAWRQVLPPGGRLPAEPERLLERALVLDNATFRLLDVRPAWTRYLLFRFRYAAVSEEKREGILPLAVNLATGALADGLAEAAESLLPAPELAAPDAAEETAPPPDAALPAPWEAARLDPFLRRALLPRLERALEGFVHGLRRRMARDEERLHRYHDDLYRAAGRRAAALAPDDPARLREQQRAETIGREYGAKLDDLSRQYALRVRVSWEQTLELLAPVQRFAVQIRRRKAERILAMDWNPALRRLESPPCEASLGTERPRLVCDEALHLLAPAGLAPCPRCFHPFCRACRPAACPRCATPQDAGASLAPIRPVSA